MSQNVHFLDHDWNIIATAVVENKGGAFSGAVELSGMPTDVRRKFEAYETLVNDQVLSLVDQIEGEVAAIPVVARFGDGCESFVEDLQMFPTTGTVSFRSLRRAPRLSCTGS